MKSVIKTFVSLKSGIIDIFFEIVSFEIKLFKPPISGKLIK